MAKYKIILDKSKCIGAGNCVQANSSNYRIEKDGKAKVIKADIDESELAKNKLAAKGCPTAAIKIIDVSSNQEIKL